jgi:hypothetical protein
VRRCTAGQNDPPYRTRGYAAPVWATTVAAARACHIRPDPFVLEVAEADGS